MIARPLIILALAMLMAACGFHLRGPRPLPFQTLHLGVSAYSELGADLRRQIRANGGTTLTEKAADAEVAVQVLSEGREKIILSLDTAGKVREYELRQRFAFRVVARDGREVLPATTLVVRREMSFNDGQVLAKEQEEVMLYREMQNDVADQVLRRLAAAPWPLPPAPAASQSAPAPATPAR